jgi:hypothetical protein
MTYRNSNELFKVPILLGLMLFSTQGFPRFNHLDADRVDAEERNNTETYNDKNSYRYPRSWDDQWQNTQFGYRSSAGSLNASRFLYDEEIRIAPNPVAKFTAAFFQSRREDLVEQTTEREIRLSWAFIPDGRISILGDGDTLKEFGDMGVALTMFESVVGKLDVYYWNVDNYYKSKKSDINAHRPVDSQTLGIFISRKSISPDVNFSFRLENDSPLEWHYPARGFEYEYWRKYAALNADWVVANDKRLYIETTQEQKMEHKTSLITVGASKRMLRRVSEIEVGVDRQASEDILYTAAIQNILRQVDYLNDKPQSDSLMWQESLSPTKVRRHEWGLILSRHGRVSDHTAIQHGFYANDVLVREDAREWKTWELKYQLLFDFNLNPNTRLGVNTTWDMDQVIRDFPYSKKAPFRPWGGGDLQFQMYL